MDEKDKNTMSDHDRLIRVDERIVLLSKQFSNHLLHHWAIVLPLCLAVVGLIIRLLTI